jgi:hypothetical protein
MNTGRTTGDAWSLVRWLTLFGTGYMQLGQTERALDFYDQALKAAASIPGLRFPEATYVGKAEALVKLNRFAEAEELLHASLVSDACTHRSEAAECVLRRPGCPLRRVRRQLPWRSICERQFLAQIVSFAAVAGGRSTPSTGTRRRTGLSFC